MAMESSSQEITGGSDLYEIDLPAKNWKKSTSTNVLGSDFTPSPGFDCNICLDFVQDPVVTLCGHLYCWPCIYKWLNLHSATATDYSDQPEPQCPVCKSVISESTLVPLYGRGKTTKTSEEKSSNLDLVIPPRPPAPVSSHMIPVSPSQQRSTQSSVHHANHFNHRLQQLHHRNFLNQPQPYFHTPTPDVRFSGYNYNTSSNSVHPVVGMFGDIIYERMFGNSMTNTYDYQNINNPFTSYSSPRLRRQVMQADKSLTRICFFLFCCIILCLLLF